jgi:hypothetical protein
MVLKLKETGQRMYPDEPLVVCYFFHENHQFYGRFQKPGTRCKTKTLSALLPGMEEEQIGFLFSSRALLQDLKTKSMLQEFHHQQQ